MKCCGRKNTSRNWLGVGGSTRATPAVTGVLVDGANLVTFKDDGTSQELNVPVLGAKQLNFVNASGTETVATVYAPEEVLNGY